MPSACLTWASYGPRPDDVERITAMGLVAYLEEQLNLEVIEDMVVDLLLRRLTAYYMDISQLIEQDERDAIPELIGATITHAPTGWSVARRGRKKGVFTFWSEQHDDGAS
jgi:hypothetical protein